MKKITLNTLGPGLLFAGAAIGVSHLVQATKAGAEYGFGLLWALLIAHLFKYPFFKFGPKYATATGESLLEGYKKLGKGYLLLYFIVNIITMFIIQTAVTIVTASLASQLFGITNNLVLWSVILLIIILLILWFGKYSLLDKLMKYIILSLTISTLIAVFIAIFKNESTYSFTPFIPREIAEIGFLIAFLGWMPAPLDISVWHSLWTVEKAKNTTKKITVEKSILDFNIGYIGTMLLGIFFIILGTLVMFKTGTEFATTGIGFATQLINIYTQTLGESFKLIIGFAAFTTMLSTTITTLDASPRAMEKASSLLFKNNKKLNYWFWILFLSIGTYIILQFFLNNMSVLVKIATIFSFLTAPIFAILNFKLITSKHTPKKFHPTSFIKVLSWLGILFLLIFSFWFISTLTI